MHRLLGNVKIQIPDSVFVKDPESTKLGKKIVTQSIELIENLGFEAFTFKKLGQAIGSPESTVYRYFANKHQLLIYLISWYWGWLEYKVVFSTANISDKHTRLKKAIIALTENASDDQQFSHISEVRLQAIVMSESSKTFLTKAVEEENESGFFSNYKRLCQRVAEIVKEVDPNYPYPHTLISTVLEGSHLQKFFSRHLTSLTDTPDDDDAIVNFFTNLALKQLHNE